MTTRSTIKTWLERGIKENLYSHMLVAWDSYDGPYEGDYPIYVPKGKNPNDYRPKNGDQVMECYDLRLDIESQLNERRANHWDV